MRRFVYVWLPDFAIIRWRIERRKQGAWCASTPPSPDSNGTNRVEVPYPARLTRPAALLRGNAAKPLAQSGSHPFVLVAEGSRGLTVSAVDWAAMQQGLVQGMTLADARAIVPGLVSQPAEPQQDVRSLRRLALWCSRFGPGVTTAGTDGIVLDITGAAHLSGGEAGLTENLSCSLRRFGLPHRIAVADTPGAAAALARYGAATATIAPPGGTAAALAPLPVERLDLAPELTHLLRRLGLKRIGQLAAIPRVSLERRFPSSRTAKQAATAVLDRLDRVLGLKADPIRPLLPPPVYAVRADFPEPLIADGGLQHALAILTAALAEQLAAAHVGVRRLVLTLYRSDGSTVLVTVGFGRPQRDASHMQQLLREKLAVIDAGFGIDLMVLAARTVDALPPRQDALTSGIGADGSVGVPIGEAVAQLLDRLSSRLGEPAVFRLEPSASHWPERAQHHATGTLVITPRSLQAAGQWRAPKQKPMRPTFLLDPPELISVTAAVPDGPPVRFRWRQCVRDVTATDGPERLAPEWWRHVAAVKPAAPGAAIGSTHADDHLLPASRYQKYAGSPPLAAVRTAASANSPATATVNIGDSSSLSWAGPPIALPDINQRTRDYYAVTAADGGRFWLFRSGLYQGGGEDEALEQSTPPSWYLHGVFA